MNSTAKNILAVTGVLLLIGITLFFVERRDRRIVNLWERNKTIVDSIYATADERKIARHFSDSLLPALTRKGLISAYRRHEIHTLITVSGLMWKERSQFFKENFMTHVLIYNKVNGFAEAVTIADSAGHIFAKIVPPGRKELFE